MRNSLLALKSLLILKKKLRSLEGNVKARKRTCLHKSEVNRKNPNLGNDEEV